MQKMCRYAAYFIGEAIYVYRSHTAPARQLTCQGRLKRVSAEWKAKEEEDNKDQAQEIEERLLSGQLELECCCEKSIDRRNWKLLAAASAIRDWKD